MTIVIAWVRNVSDCEELVFVSDSRLSGDGRLFDACPKIFTLPRSDCAIAYAGHTEDAFPMMLQFQRAIESYSPALRAGFQLTPEAQGVFGYQVAPDSRFESFRQNDRHDSTRSARLQSVRHFP
jgi:hypothetical protein